jgi:hypothetical protein
MGWPTTNVVATFRWDLTRNHHFLNQLPLVNNLSLGDMENVGSLPCELRLQCRIVHSTIWSTTYFIIIHISLELSSDTKLFDYSFKLLMIYNLFIRQRSQTFLCH